MTRCRASATTTSRTPTRRRRPLMKTSKASPLAARSSRTSCSSLPVTKNCRAAAMPRPLARSAAQPSTSASPISRSQTPSPWPRANTASTSAPWAAPVAPSCSPRTPCSSSTGTSARTTRPTFATPNLKKRTRSSPTLAAIFCRCRPAGIARTRRWRRWLRSGSVTGRTSSRPS